MCHGSMRLLPWQGCWGQVGFEFLGNWFLRRTKNIEWVTDLWVEKSCGSERVRGKQIWLIQTARKDIFHHLYKHGEQKSLWARTKHCYVEVDGLQQQNGIPHWIPLLSAKTWELFSPMEFNYVLPSLVQVSSHSLTTCMATLKWGPAQGVSYPKSAGIGIGRYR